jgi:hypothetical protein
MTEIRYNALTTQIVSRIEHRPQAAEAKRERSRPPGRTRRPFFGTLEAPTLLVHSKLLADQTRDDSLAD